MRKQFVLLLLVGLSHPIFSQTDSTLYNAVFQNETAKDASELIYNGREHIGYPSSIQGTPYYHSSDWQKGALNFQGVPYKDVFLKYDLLADEVIVRHQDGFSSVTLFMPWVQSFSLGENHFVNLIGNAPGFKSGFYEELVKGTISLYIKHSKRLTETIVTDAVKKTFVDQQNIYVSKDSQFYLIKKQKDLMDLMTDKSTEMKTWLQTSGINYKDNSATALSGIIMYYNQLSR